MNLTSDDDDSHDSKDGEHSGDDTSDPMVEINSGTVYGKLVQSPQGTDIEQYLGIPFAKTPVGDLRYADPEPLGQFEGGAYRYLCSSNIR